MTSAQLALFTGFFTGLALALLGEGGLFLSAGYPIAGSALLSAGLTSGVAALWSGRRFYRLRRPR
jgi:hypothetical protein